MEIVIAILVSWFASVLAFPTVPFQHWLNGFFRAFWKRCTSQSVGLNGKWVGVYLMPVEGGPDERRIEKISCNHLSGGEVRGKICDEITKQKYKFLGKVVFDELVAHYWTIDDERDIGNFKFEIENRSNILKGPLTVYDSVGKTTKSNVTYRWYRLPRRMSTWWAPIIASRSAINNIGAFANGRYSDGQKIGKLKLGKAEGQGVHTIELNGQHRLVMPPWQYLNHACEPNAELKWEEKSVVLIAKMEILPFEEVTIDYGLLPEAISIAFQCRCNKCRVSEKPAIIGKAAS